MQLSESYEKIFFNYSLSQPKYLVVTKDGFYSSKEIDTLAYLGKKFYEKFNETPTREQMKLLIQNSKKAEGISENIIDLVYDIKLADYDQEWLQSTAESWIKWRNFDGSLSDAIEFVKTTKVAPENVDTTIAKFKDIINKRNNLSFDKDLGLDFFNPKDHYQRLEEKIRSGKRYVDLLTNGGYDLKSLVVYAGEQNIGKSIWLANDAANFVKMGYNTAFITAEMQAHKVVKRIGANLLNISMNEYDIKLKDPNYIKTQLANVGEGLVPPGKLFVKKFPTSQATIFDIENYMLELQDTIGEHVKVIVLDYINILSNYRNPNSDNTYMKIKQLAEDLRGLADKNNWLIITATQIKRSGYDSSDITMEDIAESAGLSHTADMIYGIIQDSVMLSNEEYWLKILKIRDGEGKNAKCRFTIDYSYMRLTETEDIRGLQQRNQ